MLSRVRKEKSLSKRKGVIFSEWTKDLFFVISPKGRERKRKEKKSISEQKLDGCEF